MNNKYIDVLVLGSINTDLVVSSKRNPFPGETIMGSDFFKSPGGKGANQAVALSRLGMETYMVGCVGNDQDGKFVIDNFKANGVNTSFIKTIENATTGCAFINIFNGQNTIILYKGANEHCLPEQFPRIEELVKHSKIVLMQLEIPLETVVYISNIAKEQNTIFVLNPAPAQILPDKLISNIDYLIPNETESKIILGLKPDAEISVENLYKKFRENNFLMPIIVTMGEDGAYLFKNECISHQPPLKIKPVDTTGAGDAFIAGFCHGLLREATIEKSLEDIIKFATTVAAISITKKGTQQGLPYINEVEAFV